MDPALASGDLFNLASSDKETRQRAVALTTSCLELASDLEVERLVMHLGWVEGLEDKQVIKQAAQDGLITKELSRLLEFRTQLAPVFLDAVSFSLEKLLKRAEPLGVVLGIENRFHPHEIPDLEETELLLNRFKGAALGHWHDLGHALVQQAAGLPGPEEWLNAFGKNLSGCHLHDTRAEKDHLCPGRGNAPWPELLPLLIESPCFVLEVHPGPEPEEIKESAQMIKKLLFKAHALINKGEKAHEDSGGGGGYGKGQSGTLAP
jgi:sugar phosphate isomerase/epimerase